MQKGSRMPRKALSRSCTRVESAMGKTTCSMVSMRKKGTTSPVNPALLSDGMNCPMIHMQPIAMPHMRVKKAYAQSRALGLRRESA